jgi:plasmid stabilization system protein ParE
MKKIIWSADAVSDYEQNIEYLLEKWSIKETQQFIDEVAEILDTISKMPELFPLSDYRNIRKCVVRKQISILYTVNDDTIELVRVWNNKQNPKKLKD